MAKQRKSGAARRSRWGLLLGVGLVLGATILDTAAASLDGRPTFVERCGSCHGTSKEAKAINPAQFASLQWKNWFRRQKHSRIRDISQAVTRDEERAILDYLIRKAADSDYPETAAIP